MRWNAPSWGLQLPIRDWKGILGLKCPREWGNTLLPHGLGVASGAGGIFGFQVLEVRGESTESIQVRTVERHRGMEEFVKRFGNVDAALRTLGRDQGHVGRWAQVVAQGKDSLREPCALTRGQFILPVWGCQHCGIIHGVIHGAPGSGAASSAVKFKKINYFV